MEDMIKYGFGFSDNPKPKLVHLNTVYAQPCDEYSDDLQELVIEIGDAGAGAYYVIKTERWAFDEIDDLIILLNDFKKRANL